MRVVVGLAVPRKTPAVRLVRTLRGVQSVLRRSKRANRATKDNVSPARELTRPLPGLFRAAERRGLSNQKEAPCLRSPSPDLMSQATR
jgi:hypothetical protein